jgi:hypothetical protein
MSHYFRSNPPVVLQGTPTLCWAASLHSWLKATVWATGKQQGTWTGEAAARNHIDGAPWTRQILDFDDIMNLWGDLTDGGNQALSPDGVKQVAIDLGMGGDILRPTQLTYDYIKMRLQAGHLYMAYFSHHMYHAVVVYGVSTTDGIAVMDPNPDEGGLIYRKIEFFQDPIRVNKIMFVGWPIQGTRMP